MASLSLPTKEVKEGRLAVSVLLIARWLSVGDYRQVRQPCRQLRRATNRPPTDSDDDDEIDDDKSC